MIKRFIFGLLLVLVILGLTGCNQQSNATTSNEKVSLQSKSYEVTSGTLNEVHRQRPIEDHEIVIREHAFIPTSLKIKAGDSVTWIKLDNNNHTLVEQKGYFYSGDILKIRRHFTFVFNKKGIYNYRDADSGATGEIIVE